MNLSMREIKGANQRAGAQLICVFDFCICRFNHDVALIDTDQFFFLKLAVGICLQIT